MNSVININYLTKKITQRVLLWFLVSWVLWVFSFCFGDKKIFKLLKISIYPGTVKFSRYKRYLYRKEVTWMPYLCQGILLLRTISTSHLFILMKAAGLTIAFFMLSTRFKNLFQLLLFNY